MASKLMLVIMAIAAVAVIIPEVAMATEYVVGEDKGWSPGVNYTEWTEGKQFFVGDTLVFVYSPESHNVYKVSGPDFRACRVPAGGVAMTTGNDVVTLATPGRKWYICGVAGHCGAGQKLVLTVQSQAPASPPQC